jgi:hypothetical protein
MKNKISILLYIVMLSLISFGTKAQYLTGIGARLGTSNGVTVIRYFADRTRSAGDLIVANEFKGWCGTLLYELHFNNHSENIEVANVGFFLGVGGHAGVFKDRIYLDLLKGTNKANKTSVFAAGVDAIAGVEWKLPHVPLLLSVDIKPFYDINVSHFAIDVCGSLRYLF